MGARIKSKAAMWRRVVRGHGRSGMSIRAYCAQHRIKEPAFYWWRRELARRDVASSATGKPPSPGAAFVPVVVESPAAGDRVEGVMIELRGGRMLRLPAMAVGQMVELICALEGDGKAGAA